MSWTHNVCARCYQIEEPDRAAIALREPEPAACCRCGALNTDGIYYRKDPAAYKCQHYDKAS